MVLVTGATGHIGNVLVRKLVQKGEKVRALVLRGEPLHALAGLDVDFVEGNVLAKADCLAAAAGVRTVYHLAGIIAITPGSQQLMWDVNVDGASNMARASLESGVKQFVHVGSVHGLARRPGEIVAAEAALCLQAPKDTYDRTKAEGIEAVMDVAADGLKTMVACPSGVIGPYDYAESEMGRLIKNLARPGYKLLVDGGFDFVDVRDVAAGLIKMAAFGRPGQTYILSGTYVSLTELHQLAQRANRPQAKAASVIVPAGLALLAGKFMPYYYRLTGNVPLVTTYSLHTVAEKCRFSHQKAIDELGYKSRPIQQTVSDTLVWWSNLPNR